jgi:hypothetical protein
MTERARLSATIAPELLAAGKAAVKAGRAGSLSAWVNTALARHVDHERRMEALDALLAGYEAEHGVITDTEIEAATRRSRERATVVRGAPRTSGSTPRREGKAKRGAA